MNDGQAAHTQTGTGKAADFLYLTPPSFLKTTDDFQQIQGGPQIGFSRNLLASLNLLEITNHDDAGFTSEETKMRALKDLIETFWSFARPRDSKISCQRLPLGLIGSGNTVPA
jgi:hypothetical protein